MGANISLIGNLGREPETEITDNGTFMAKFSIASNTFRNTSNGRVEKVDWFRVTAFGKQAETIARYVRKGHRLYVQGRLTFNPWLDRSETPQAGAEVTLQEFQFLTEKRDDDGGEDAAAVVPQQMDMPAEIRQAAAY
ncbi:MAG: single-stranded DNA-binding protein [Acidobacteria bacterium]|nr:single-stranded DNA-binding protein [Acidobacteriota bacterium]